MASPSLQALSYFPTRIAALLAHTARLTRFFLRIVRACLGGRWPKRDVVTQMVEVGLDSLLVLVGVSVFIGMSVALEGYSVFVRFGGSDMLGAFCGMSLIRELCPAIAAAILAAKVGTRIAAALGLMRIKQQIDALDVMAVDPLVYLVAPRFLATLVMVPCLILVSDVTALAASFAVAHWQLGIETGTFWKFVTDFVRFDDLMKGMVKGIVFGALISTLACYFGYYAEDGPEGVGRATNRTVVFSAILAIAANLLMTDVMYT